MTPTDPLLALDAVRDRVDAFMRQAESTQARYLRCGAGCASCCHLERSAFSVEVEAIRRWLSAHPAVAARAEERLPRADRCVYLEDDDRCGIYPVRPTLCRTHGPAVRAEGALGWCALNFAALEPSEVERAVPASAILDVELVNRMLVVVNAAYLAASGGPVRQPLRAALTGARARATKESP